jgi:hypothetical protein
MKYDTNIPNIVNVSYDQFHKQRGASVAMVTPTVFLSYARYYAVTAALLFRDETAVPFFLISLLN